MIENHGRYYLPVKVAGKQKWKPLTRVEEGTDALYRALAAIAPDAKPGIGNVPARISEFKKEWLKTLSAKAQDEYERILDNIATGLQKFNTEDVSSADCGDIVAQFKDSPTAARAYKSRMSTFFRWCCGKRDELRRPYALSNPVRDVWLAAPPVRDVRIDPASFWKIHAALATSKPDGNGIIRPTPTGPIAQCLIEIFYLIEQRSTDLRFLTLSQIREGFIHFKPSKTEKSSGAKVKWKVTPAIQDVLDRAAEIRKQHSIASIYVFPTPEGGPYSARRFLGMWNRALSRCGLEDSGFVPKDILPSSMSDAEESGYSVKELQTGRAHMSITTTEGYLKKRRVLESPIELDLPPKK